MKLSKRIPGRTKTVEFNWCKKDFMKMDQDYRDIRGGLRGRRKGTMIDCFWCGHKFKDGEMMALAQPKKGTNKILCHVCVDEILKP